MSVPLALDKARIDPQLAMSLLRLASKATDGSVDRVLKHKAINTADSNAVDDTSSEENFSLNQTITSNMFKVGNTLKVVASGVFTSSGGPTLQFRVKFGSTNLVVFTAQTGQTGVSDVPFIITAYIPIRSLGTSGTVMPFGELNIKTAAGTGTVEPIVSVSAVTVDTTVAQTLQVSLQWSVAAAGNTATLKSLLVFCTDYA